MANDKVSMVIVCWNNADALATCLSGLLSRTDDAEVVVVDMGPAADTARVCQKFKSRIQRLSHKGRISFSSAANLGIKATTGNFVLLLNADWLIQENSLDHLLQAMASDPAIGAVSGQLLNSDGTIQIGYNVRRFPTVLTMALDFLLLHKIFPNNAITRYHRMLDYDHLETRAVDVALSGCLLIRRAVFNAISLFDEALGPAWIEDIDFCRRMKAAGYILLYCPAAKVVHIDSEKNLPPSATSKHSMVWEEHTFFYQSYLRYSQKYFGRFATLFLRVCIAWGMMARIAFSWFTPHRLRLKLGRWFNLYDPDTMVRNYRNVYWHTLGRMLFDWRL